MVYFIIWEKHGFSHKFPKIWEKAGKPVKWGKAWEIGSQENPTKPSVCGEPGKLVFILFP